MGEISQYSFDLKEVTKYLIRREGIKEGKWVLGFEFNLGAGLIGNAAESILPGAIVTINKMILTKHQEGTPEPPFLVDAAEVNT